MNVTDLRTAMRRTPINIEAGRFSDNERRKGDRRRGLTAEQALKDEKPHRIWLTPGERALIEDLYFLDDK
ncbi:MAG: hypothetical protein IPN42_14955 [Methylococcaceae bacterium]|nr:hypothetical protein [Methylococcaceae bacterium]